MMAGLFLSGGILPPTRGKVALFWGTLPPTGGKIALSRGIFPPFTATVAPTSAWLPLTCATVAPTCAVNALDKKQGNLTRKKIRPKGGFLYLSAG